MLWSDKKYRLYGLEYRTGIGLGRHGAWPGLSTPRILTIEQRQLFVDPRVLFMQPMRSGEEILAYNGEKLCRSRSTVRIYIRSMMVLQLILQVCKCLAESLGPVLSDHATLQWRDAVSAAVEHVELVGKLMYDHIVARTGSGQIGHDIVPGKNHWTARPGFATQRLILMRDKS
jgi:hypothetical protein